MTSRRGATPAGLKAPGDVSDLAAPAPASTTFSRTNTRPVPTSNTAVPPMQLASYDAHELYEIGNNIPVIYDASVSDKLHKIQSIPFYDKTAIDFNNNIVTYLLAGTLLICLIDKYWLMRRRFSGKNESQCW